VPTSVATAAATDSGKPENTSIKAINIELERKNFFCFVKLSIQRWPGKLPEVIVNCKICMSLEALTHNIQKTVMQFTTAER
jgi:hypothetical protein